MKLLILCVDGFDPDYARENGYDRLPYSKKLTIPRECYVETPLGPTPHTVRVWPSIFSGQAIDYGLTVRGPLRQYVHDFLVKIRVTWQGRPMYRLAPTNEALPTVFSDYPSSFLWNIPTICPEWITEFPTYDQFIAYCKREYMQFSILARGLPAYPIHVGAVYTRIMDAWAHTRPDEELVQLYEDIANLVFKLARAQTGAGLDLMLLSDHGTLRAPGEELGAHTDHAYVGATFPFEAESVVDIRRVIEERLGPPSARDEKGSSEELSEEEEKAIIKNLKRLGYIA